MRLVVMGGTVIEQIVSSDQPDRRWYDQSDDGWVVVMTGAATLEVGTATVRLAAGEWVILPAHTRHRVVVTDVGTSWLAVHVAARG